MGGAGCGSGEATATAAGRSMLGADAAAQAASAMSAMPQTIALAAMNEPCPDRVARVADRVAGP
jgi:hypothetical protein